MNKKYVKALELTLGFFVCKDILNLGFNYIYMFVYLW